jgi:hypothetical protein
MCRVIIYREEVSMQPISSKHGPNYLFLYPDTQHGGPALADYLDSTQQAVPFDQASKERKAETSNREPGHRPTPSEPRTTNFNRLASDSESAGPDCCDSGCVVRTWAPYGGHAACRHGVGMARGQQAHLKLRPTPPQE